jgi:protein gp37
MASKSSIEWTQATWNPIAGCSIVSPGCTNCYAMRRVAPRLAANPATPHYAGTVEKTKAGYVWTGKVGIAGDKVLTAPLRWRQPRMIFVNSTSDLFHPDVPDEAIDRVFAVMGLCPQHTFQVLTKRPERMRAYLSDPRADRRIHGLVCDMAVEERPNVTLIADRAHEAFAPPGMRIFLDLWPLPNVWLGTSVEDQRRAAERLPQLLDTPAAVRFVSAEPLLEGIEIPNYLSRLGGMPGLDWVIVGGESGPGSRPMHPDWARSLRDQCAAAGVPFFFKQHGNWREPLPGEEYDTSLGRAQRIPAFILSHDGTVHCFEGEHVHEPSVVVREVGKAAAGRLLDGVEHNAMPEVRHG